MLLFGSTIISLIVLVGFQSKAYGSSKLDVDASVVAAAMVPESQRPAAIDGLTLRLWRAGRATDIRLIIAALTVVVLALIAWRHFTAIRRYPPGPFPLPIIGNLHQIDIAYPYRSMLKWQRRYGGVFTVWMLKPTIVVADWEALQRLLLNPNGEHSLDRPNSYVFRIFTRHKPEGDGIILCSGARWRSQRRFALSAFKSFGMGGSRMEELIGRHKDELIRRLDAAIGNRETTANRRPAILRAKGDYGSAWAAAASTGRVTSFTDTASVGDKMPSSVVGNINEQLAFCFGNVIHDLVMGRYYCYNDPEFLMFKHLIDKTLERECNELKFRKLKFVASLVFSLTMMIVDCYPWTRHFFQQYHDYVRDGYRLQRFFLDEIERHAARLDVDAQPTNIIDAYLIDMYRQDDYNLSKVTLALNAGDLWTGGLETVVTTLTWAILYFIHYPETQKRLQTELDTILEGRVFQTSDRQRLPYLRATIDELQRIVNVLPWHIPHSCDQTLEVCGRTIPCGVTIMPQFGAVHFDDQLFSEPEIFRPERFLHRDETAGTWTYVPNEHLAPFGLGKRACLGEGLARMELSIVLTALAQNFQFENTGDVNGRSLGALPSLQRQVGMTSKPAPFKCRIRRRHDGPLILSNPTVTSQ